MGEGRITRGVALRNGGPSVNSASFTLPLPKVSVPASTVGFHFIVSSWRSIDKVIDVNCSSTVFVVVVVVCYVVSPVYLIIYILPVWI